MNPSQDEINEIQPSLEEEVDTLFQKTQGIPSSFNDAYDAYDAYNMYDMYIPLSVRIADPNWNVLSPIADVVANTEIEKEELEEVKFPVASVKRLMKMDPDVKIISKQALNIMCKATTLFIDFLAEKVKERVETDGSRQIKNSTILQVCNQIPSLMFLQDDLNMEEMESKRVRISKPKIEEHPNAPTVKNDISAFFSKHN